MRIYSIDEIVTATNDLLVSKDKNEIGAHLEKIPAQTIKIITEAEKSLVIKKQKEEVPLILGNEVSPIKTSSQFNYKIKIKPEVKNHIIEELYTFLKKKIKKNTLKLIIDDQIEIKNLNNKINFLKSDKNQLNADYKLLKIKYDQISENYKILNFNNKNLRNILELTKTEKDQLDTENKKINIDLKEESEKSEEIIKKNRTLEINNYELKSTVSRYITNYKKVVEEINQLKKSEKEDSNDEALKLKFYQNENVRLSSELLSAQKINENIKDNLNNIKLEKEKISHKIFELNKAISSEKSNIIPSSFVQEVTRADDATNTDIIKKTEDRKKEINSLTKSEKESLDEVNNRIFAKI